MFNHTGQWLMIMLLVAAAAAQAQSPQLGTPTAVEPTDRMSVAILPDGYGLPAGSGNAAAGSVLYQTHCLACHGSNGQGGINDTLAGGQGTLTSTRPVQTIGSYWPYATTLFDYIRRAMPYPTPGSLTDVEVYALTAYLLHINGIIDSELQIDARTLPEVKMPNQNGFVFIMK